VVVNIVKKINKCPKAQEIFIKVRFRSPFYIYPFTAKNPKRPPYTIRIQAPTKNIIFPGLAIFSSKLLINDFILNFLEVISN